MEESTPPEPTLSPSNTVVNKISRTGILERLPGVGSLRDFLVKKEKFPSRKFPDTLTQLDGQAYTDYLVDNVADLEVALPSLDELHDLGRGTVHLINLVIDKRLDTLFFLDKSARPAAHLFRKTWQRLYPGYPLPDIKFINIGRRDSKYDIVTKDTKRELRDRFTPLTGRRIGVVDDVISSGGTMTRAKKVLESVFPSVSQFCYTAMFSQLPKWYGQRYEIGVQDYGEDPSAPHFITQPVLKDIPPQFPNVRAVRSLIVRDLRRQLDRFSAIVAQHTNQVPMNSFEVVPHGKKELEEEARRALSVFSSSKQSRT